MEKKYILSDDTWGLEEKKAILEVLDSGVFTMGEYVKKYENEFAKYFNTKYAIMSNSGSSANLLAVAALIYSERLRSGDEVIVPAVSWSTTYFPLVQYGLKLKFIDVNRDTLNIDVSLIEGAITKQTKAIFTVNLLGNSNDYDRLLEICNNYNILLLEDNCESMGGEYKGEYLGTFGLLGTFSSFYSHHICTMEGGMTVTNDEELYHYMLSIRAHGWTRNIPANSTVYKKSEDSFYESFNFIMPGYNLRPLEMEAAVGLKQLKRLESFVLQRRKNAEYFKEKMKNLEGFATQTEVGKSSWFGFAILVDGNSMNARKKIVKEFMDNGIEVRPVVAGNFTKSKAMKYINYSIYRELDNADYIHDNSFFIGNHSIDIRNEIDYMVEVLEGIN